MDRGRTLRNFLVALSVQGWAFVVSAVTTFVIPKVMQGEVFGYWQLFLFYVGLVGFLQLGISDGAYLRFGGQSRSVIDRRSVSQQFIIETLMQVVVGAGVACLAFATSDPSRQLVIISVALLAPIMNGKRYWCYIFQAMNETRLFSYSIVVSTVVFFSGMVILMGCGITDLLPYILSYLAGEILALVYCLWRASDLVTPQHPFDWRAAVAESLASLRVGVKLLVASLSGLLIVGAARVTVDYLWDIRVFGQVSLAVTLVGFVLTLMAQASIVLFPALRQASAANAVRAVGEIRRLALALLPLAYLLFFPFLWVMEAWLPSYSRAFEMTALLVPLCITDGLMQVLYSTYLKVVRRETELMWVNVSAMAVSAVGSVAAGLALGRVEAVLLAPVVASMARAIFADWRLVRSTGIGTRAGALGQVPLAVCFVWSSQTLAEPWFLLVTVAMCGAHLALHWRVWASTLGRVLRRLSLGSGGSFGSDTRPEELEGGSR